MPENIKQLRSFLGICVFCSQFIPKYGELVAPLNNLLKGETKKSIKKITWSDIETSAFKKIKDQIAKISSRTLPDFSRPFILTTDASSKAYGAVLT